MDWIVKTFRGYLFEVITISPDKMRFNYRHELNQVNGEASQSCKCTICATQGMHHLEINACAFINTQ